jgi:ribonuclease HI
VKNVGIIRYLSAHLDARARFGQKIRLQYVKGHSGETGNDGADAQANLGALSSTEPERDWGKLEKKLAKRVEEEWRGQLDKPSTVPMEVEGDAVEQSLESPMKVRKTGRELTSQQFPRATSKSLSSALPVLPTIPNKQPPDLSLPRGAGSLRQISSFKAAEVASPSPPKREIPRATSKLADLPSPAIIASTAKQTSPVKQMTDASRRSPSPSKYPQKTQVRTPKTPSRISHAVTSSHPGTPGKLLRDPVPLVNPSAAGLTASTLRNKTKGSIAEGPKTPNRTTKTVQVQTTPTPIAEVEPAVRIPDTLGIPPIVVNKEDIDFTVRGLSMVYYTSRSLKQHRFQQMFEDCAIDDEDMWKDLWP